MSFPFDAVLQIEWAQLIHYSVIHPICHECSLSYDRGGIQFLFPRDLCESFLVQDDVGYAMWNDEFPSNLTWAGGAHAKGVLAFGATRGFWMTHSVSSLLLCTFLFHRLEHYSLSLTGWIAY